MTHCCIHIFAVGILEKACIGLSLLISSVSIYVCEKKLTICCWTSLYPWHHPCCCRCRFFLLFLRLFAPRRRSLLGLVLLNPPHLPAPSLFPAFRCSHHLTALTTAWSHLPNDGCSGCTTNSLAWFPLLSLTNSHTSDVWIDLYSNGICLKLSECSWPKTVNNVLERMEAGEGSILRHCLSTLQPFATSLLHITSQSPHCDMLNSAFHTMLFSRASYPECIFSKSGPGGKWAPHLHRISAMINPSTALFLSQEDRKWLGFAVCALQFHSANDSHPSIRHAGNSRNPPPLQIAEKQLGLFSHWCISFIYERVNCVCMRVCVCACACTSCDCYATVPHPSLFSVSHSANLKLFLSSCAHIQLTRLTYMTSVLTWYSHAHMYIQTAFWLSALAARRSLPVEEMGDKIHSLCSLEKQLIV